MVMETSELLLSSFVGCTDLYHNLKRNTTLASFFFYSECIGTPAMPSSSHILSRSKIFVFKNFANDVKFSDYIQLQNVTKSLLPASNSKLLKKYYSNYGIAFFNNYSSHFRKNHKSGLLYM